MMYPRPVANRSNRKADKREIAKRGPKQPLRFWGVEVRFRSTQKNRKRTSVGSKKRVSIGSKRTQNAIRYILSGANRQKQYLAVWMRIGRRVVWEGKFPLAIAIAWVCYKHTTATLFGDMAAQALSALTIALIIQGNILRIAKNIRDEDHVKRTAANFKKLTGSVETTKALVWSIYSTQQAGVTKKVGSHPVLDNVGAPS
jgi:hypothetical protein